MNLLVAHLDEYAAEKPEPKPGWLIRLRAFGVAARAAWQKPPSPRAKTVADVIMLIAGILAYIYLLWLFSEHTTLMPAGR